MRVFDIMSKKLVTVQMDDPLSVIKNIFENTRFHHLLVVESKKLIGLVSDRDFFKAVSPNLGSASETAKDVATLNKKTHQIMSRNLITLKQNVSVYEAISLFNNHTVSCLPVVDDNNCPVGIISWRDILKAIEVNRDKRKKSEP